MKIKSINLYDALKCVVEYYFTIDTTIAVVKHTYRNVVRSLI